MKKTLVALFTLIALSFGIQAFAACPCDPCAKPCDCDCECPCEPCKCCEGWLNCKCLEDYFCRIGLSECQKCDARKAVQDFVFCTQCLRCKDCQCETKCECRSYRKALRVLDCKMKNIITKCQKSDYRCVRKEVKEQVKCCHKCLINPFYRCKCCDCNCGCACGCNCGCGCKCKSGCGCGCK